MYLSKIIQAIEHKNSFLEIESFDPCIVLNPAQPSFFKCFTGRVGGPLRHTSHTFSSVLVYSSKSFHAGHLA